MCVRIRLERKPDSVQSNEHAYTHIIHTHTHKHNHTHTTYIHYVFCLCLFMYLGLINSFFISQNVSLHSFSSQSITCTPQEEKVSKEEKQVN